MYDVFFMSVNYNIILNLNKNDFLKVSFTTNLLLETILDVKDLSSLSG